MMLQTQRGSSLIVGLVMLIMITLLVVSAFNASTTNQKIVYNAQLTAEAATVGQTAIDDTLSDLNFMTKPIDPVSHIASWNETVGKFTPQISAQCLQGRIMSNAEAATQLSRDCLWDPDTGGVYVQGKTSAGSNSLCANTTWDIQATTANAFDANASVELHQGVEIKSTRDKISAACL